MNIVAWEDIAKNAEGLYEVVLKQYADQEKWKFIQKIL